MSGSICFSPLASFKPIAKPGLISAPAHSNVRKVQWISDVGSSRSMEIKATDGGTPATKSRSLVCTQCEGEGNIKCKQCQGTGVNSIDHFDGRFKAGGLCWLCRGKREVLCGECNGAGFLGGIMSTLDSD